MRTATGSALIPASIDEILGTLLDATRLPEWNPAFVSVRGPATAERGSVYELRAIKALRGEFRYSHVSRNRVETRWDVPGLAEVASWDLGDSDGSRTLVTHAVSRTGPLGALLAGTLESLPKLRLDRLTARVS